MIRKIMALCIASLAINAVAQDDAKVWSGESELGFKKTSGNTNESTLTFRQKLVYDKKPWKNTLTLSADNGKTEGVRTDEHYYGTEQLDRFVTDASYGFLRATYDKDRFSGYEYQSTAVIGYGNQFLDGDVFKMKAEIGVGQRSDKIDSIAGAAAEKNDEAIVYLSEELSWNISGSAELGQSASTEYGKDNTVSRFDIFVRSNLVENLAVKVSYGIKYNDVVPAGDKKKDEEFLTTLVYSF